ncbi:MAG: hypothetical protein ABIP51_18775 [Bacteroidia bacterium]
MTIYNFARLALKEKTNLIENQAIFLDNYMDNGNLINTYFFEGFFVESTIDLNAGKIIDILPFQHGYKLDKKKVDDYLKMAC